MVTTRHRTSRTAPNQGNNSDEDEAPETPTATTTVSIPDDVFRIARGKRERNNRDYQGYAKMAAQVLGISVKAFDAAFAARLERVIAEEKEMERRGALDAFRKTIAQYKVPTNLKALQEKAKSIAEELSTEDAPVFIDLVVTDAGLDVAMRRPRRPRNPDAEVGERSRISAWEAYLRGQREGDAFKVEKLGIREYRDADGNAFSNLTAWLAENHPDSHAATILRKYGQIQ